MNSVTNIVHAKQYMIPDYSTEHMAWQQRVDKEITSQNK